MFIKCRHNSEGLIEKYGKKTNVQKIFKINKNLEFSHPKQ